MIQLPAPNQLGAPQRFGEWRTGQADALIQGWGATTRAVVYDLPTGIGKSLVNVTHSTGLGHSFTYLTVSRGLQDQVMREFASIGLVDVRGMQNYECLEAPGRRRMCDRGPCLDGGDCGLRFRGCLYYDQVRLWLSQPRRLTNYAFWLSRARKGDPVGRLDTLVMDEAHDAAEMVAGAMRVVVTKDEARLPREFPQHLGELKIWADKERASAKRELEAAITGTQEHRELKDLVGRFETLMDAEGAWVWEMTADAIIVEPVWAAPYAERLLYRGIPKLLFSSATMSKGDLRFLGLRPEDCTWISALCPFPAKNRPLIYIPTSQVSQGMSDEALEALVARVDEILDVEAANKGLIHAVSYKLAKLIYHASRHTRRMLLPTSRTTREVVERFKAARQPLVLISPAIDTGYDFPYDAARFQIIPKLPFPPVKGSPILARRQDEDKQYSNHITLKRITQMYGRVNRAEDDEGRTYVLDTNWGRWFWPAMRAEFPAWLREAVRTETKVPGLSPASRAA